MILNITSGEYFNNYIKSKYDGNFVPFNEAMITGPSSDDIFSEHFIKIRSNYHSISPTEYKDKLNILLNPNLINTFDEINLWFGEDTFCVINLLTVLAYLEQIQYNGLVFYTRINDFTNEVIQDKEELQLGNYKKIFSSVIINKKRIVSNHQTIDYSIQQYLLLHKHQDKVSNYIKNNLNLDDNILLINTLQISDKLGLSDTIIKKLIQRHKFDYYNLFYNEQLIGVIELNLATNIVKYKTISNNEPILELLKTDLNDSIENFPFIQSRIENMNNFNLTEVSYPTDNYRLVKIDKGVL